MQDNSEKNLSVKTEEVIEFIHKTVHVGRNVSNELLRTSVLWKLSAIRDSYPEVKFNSHKDWVKEAY